MLLDQISDRYSYWKLIGVNLTSKNIRKIFMEIIISNTKEELGRKAAERGADLIRNAIEKNGYANIIVATGASQFEMLSVLIKEDLDWSKVTGFHLDEYIGVSEEHPASFRKYLR
jgi:glucosamine-6-phosphate deaminase